MFIAEKMDLGNSPFHFFEIHFRYYPTQMKWTHVYNYESK